MKKLLTKEFLIMLVVSFFAFEGIEHLLHMYFGVSLSHALSLGGLGTVLLFGFKLHIICCALPAICTTLYCAHKNHKHCKHEHGTDAHQGGE